MVVKKAGHDKMEATKRLLDRRGKRCVILYRELEEIKG
jgi:hypothetical protein